MAEDQKPILGRPYLLATPSYKPGDLPPEGYLAWHAWAEVQRKAGIKQGECPTCGLWKTPQELSTHAVGWTARNRYGQRIEGSAFECSKCFAAAHPSDSAEPPQLEDARG